MTDADSQITVRELIGNVESEGAELTTFDANSVKEAQRLKKIMESRILSIDKKPTANPQVNPQTRLVKL